MSGYQLRRLMHYLQIGDIRSPHLQSYNLKFKNDLISINNNHNSSKLIWKIIKKI